MKKLILFSFLNCVNVQVFAQFIGLDLQNNSGTFIINKSGIGLDVSNQSGIIRLGTKIENGKAILQTHTNDNLVFITNNSSTNSLVFSTETLSIGPDFFTPGRIRVNQGRLKFTGNKVNNNASGLEFTNAAGTTLRGFVGMVDNGTHLGLWGYGNNTWNIRWNLTNGFMGVGAIDPLARLHVNGNMRIVNINPTTTDAMAYAQSNGVLQSRSVQQVYTVSSLDLKYISGTTTTVGSRVGRFYFSTTTTGNPKIVTPVALPNGVKLQELVFDFVDNTSYRDMKVCLVKTNYNGDNLVEIGCLNTFFNTNNASPRSRTITLPAEFIDNTNNMYSLIVSSIDNFDDPATWQGSSLQYIKTNIKYSYSPYVF